MPIKSVTSDKDALSLTVVGEYPVPVERLWAAYADPRQLERFWGPETWPATFTRHDMAVGGRSEYSMTGPDGTTSRGWWRFVSVEPGRGMEVEDGFANEDGTPNDAMPSMRMVFTFEETPTGSRFTSVTSFPSVEAMRQLVDKAVSHLESVPDARLHVIADASHNVMADRPEEFVRVVTDFRNRKSSRWIGLTWRTLPVTTTRGWSKREGTRSG